MKLLIAALMTTVFSALGVAPSYAQTAPTVTVTPNQQTTQATAVSNPTGQNISQQNNFYDPSANSFGPGISCSGPYLAGSVYRNDSSSPGVPETGYAAIGTTIGIVVPLNGSNKKCQEMVNEIVFQRQIDTCLSMMKQGFSFDPDGQYGNLAKRCQGIHYTGQPVSSANPISPPPPPTVITVPAKPSSTAPVPLPVVPAKATAAAAAAPADTAQTAAAAHARNVVPLSSTCQPMSAEKKRALLARFKAGKDRHDALGALHAACVPDSEIMASL